VSVVKRQRGLGDCAECRSADICSCLQRNGDCCRHQQFIYQVNAD